ncbi:hypothetical protein BpHYR1_014879 [Brachionus plicatilis]|uniref:Uncharacterized protein n=1 Tax=Brachionus plicatilis TaxID=10195 RepID=A0A3M7T8B1_BRAPC|nr:hypothetical protein BpHYR1_014879 [Brachionus plicatilis]
MKVIKYCDGYLCAEISRERNTFLLVSRKKFTSSFFAQYFCQIPQNKTKFNDFLNRNEQILI